MSSNSARITQQSTEQLPPMMAMRRKRRNKRYTLSAQKHYNDNETSDTNLAAAAAADNNCSSRDENNPTDFEWTHDDAYSYTHRRQLNQEQQLYQRKDSECFTRGFSNHCRTNKRRRQVDHKRIKTLDAQTATSSHISHVEAETKTGYATAPNATGIQINATTTEVTGTKSTAGTVVPKSEIFTDNNSCNHISTSLPMLLYSREAGYTRQSSRKCYTHLHGKESWKSLLLKRPLYPPSTSNTHSFTLPSIAGGNSNASSIGKQQIMSHMKRLAHWDCLQYSSPTYYYHYDNDGVDDKNQNNSHNKNDGNRERELNNVPQQESNNISNECNDGSSNRNEHSNNNDTHTNNNLITNDNNRNNNNLIQLHKKEWRPFTKKECIPFSKLQTPTSDAILAMDRFGSFLIGIGGGIAVNRDVTRSTFGARAANSSRKHLPHLSLRFYGE